MYVRVRRLRLGGRRIPDHEADRAEHQVVGDLRSIGKTFELHAHLSNTGALQTLHDARVVAIHPGTGGMFVRGYEEHRGAAVLQEWEVVPLERVIGPNGIQLWAGID